MSNEEKLIIKLATRLKASLEFSVATPPPRNDYVLGSLYNSEILRQHVDSVLAGVLACFNTTAKTLDDCDPDRINAARSQLFLFVYFCAMSGEIAGEALAWEHVARGSKDPVVQHLLRRLDEHRESDKAINEALESIARASSDES